MKLKIALAQINPVTGDIEGNTAKILEYAEKAKKSGAEIVVFPELIIPGYCSADRFENIEFVKENKKALEKIAKKINGIVVIAGFVDYDEEQTSESGGIAKFNAGAVIKDGRIIGIFRKKLLPNYRFFDEKRYFNSDAERAKPIKVRINRKKVSLGLLICEDIWDENYERKPVNELKDRADIIIAINGSPFYAGKLNERIELIKKHVKNTRLPFIYLNAVGVSDNVKNILVFDGFTMVFDRKGNLAAHAGQFREELKLVSFDTEKIYKEKQKPETSWEEEVFNALVLGLRDYCRKTGFKKAVLGLSGGIDSSVAAVIAAEALGRENVLGVNMPSKFNRPELKNAARKLAHAIGIEYRVTPIQRIVDRFIQEHEAHFGKIKKRVTIENIQARVRGNLLMAISNDTGKLLLSTGNKTEIALGYCTLYGDMSGGIEVIGDVNKMQVYALANYINKNGKYKGAIPQETIRAKPDAELWKNSEGDPFDYKCVAPLVDDIIIEHRTKEELLALFRKKKLVYAAHLKESEFEKILDDVFRRIKSSVYKRGQAPPIIIVSKRAFGYDLRETIIDRWHS